MSYCVGHRQKVDFFEGVISGLKNYESTSESIMMQFSLCRNEPSRILKLSCLALGISGSRSKESTTAHELRGAVATIRLDQYFSNCSVALRTYYKYFEKPRSYLHICNATGWKVYCANQCNYRDRRQQQSYKNFLGAVFHFITGGNISFIVNNFHGGNSDNEKPLESRSSFAA